MLDGLGKMKNPKTIVDEKLVDFNATMAYRLVKELETIGLVCRFGKGYRLTKKGLLYLTEFHVWTPEMGLAYRDFMYHIRGIKI
jgi:predicted transcriptional regulator